MNKFILFHNISDEIELKRISGVTKTLLLISVFASILLSIFEGLVSSVLQISDYILWTFTGLLVIIYIIYRLNKVSLAGTLYVVCLWISMTLIAWVHGGVMDISIVTYIISLYTAILIAQQGLALLLSVLSIFSLWGLYFAEYNHSINPSNTQILNYSIEFTVIMIIVFTLIFLNDQSFKLAYKRIHKEYEDRLKAEKSEKISEEKYRTIFKNMFNGFALYELVFDDNGKTIDIKILEANEAAAGYYNYKPNEVINKTIKELKNYFNPEEHKNTIHVGITGEPANFEKYIKITDRYFRVNMFSPQKFCTACYYGRYNR